MVELQFREEERWYSCPLHLSEHIQILYSLLCITPSEGEEHTRKYSNVRSESESHSVVSNSLRPHRLYSMEFSRPEYWRGQPFPSPGDLPNPGIKQGSPALQTDSLPTELWGKPLSGGKGCQMWQRSWRRRHSGWVISESPWVENAQLNIEYWVWNISQSGNQDSWPMSETDILCALRAYFLNL